MSPYEKNFLAVPTSHDPPSQVTVKFLGNTNFLISDGDSAILIDGYFSYPTSGILSTAFARIGPDRERIAGALLPSDLQKLNYIIPIHSHYDHAMDVGELAYLAPRAQVIGSESTRNIIRGWEVWNRRRGDQSYDDLSEYPRFLPARTIHPGAPESAPYRAGNFRIWLLPARHTPSWLNKKFGSGDINSPLVPPQSIFSYKEGESYSVLVKYCPNETCTQSLLIIGSAGLPPVINGTPVLEGLDVDVLFLGIAGMAAKEDDLVSYLERTVDTVSPEVVVPVHWDSLFVPPTAKGVTPPSGLYARSAKISDGLAILCRDIELYARSARDGPRQFLILPHDTPVPLFAMENQARASDRVCPDISGRRYKGELMARWDSMAVLAD